MGEFYLDVPSWQIPWENRSGVPPEELRAVFHLEVVSQPKRRFHAEARRTNQPSNSYNQAGYCTSSEMHFGIPDMTERPR